MARPTHTPNVVPPTFDSLIWRKADRFVPSQYKTTSGIKDLHLIYPSTSMLSRFLHESIHTNENAFWLGASSRLTSRKLLRFSHQTEQIPNWSMIPKIEAACCFNFVSKYLLTAWLQVPLNQPFTVRLLPSPSSFLVFFEGLTAKTHSTINTSNG